MFLGLVLWLCLLSHFWVARSRLSLWLSLGNFVVIVYFLVLVESIVLGKPICVRVRRLDGPFLCCREFMFGFLCNTPLKLRRSVHLNFHMVVLRQVPVGGHKLFELVLKFRTGQSTISVHPVVLSTIKSSSILLLSVSSFQRKRVTLVPNNSWR